LRSDRVGRDKIVLYGRTRSLLSLEKAPMKEANVAVRSVVTSVSREQDAPEPGDAITDMPFNLIAAVLTRLGLFERDIDHQLIRASMVLIYLMFGYQKWFEYEAEVLVPYISNGPLIFWMYPAFGIRGASWFLGASEWLIGVLLFLGFWNKRIGILGAIGSCITFVCTVTIIPFMPDGWAPSAGGFPAMVGNVPFLMKDVVLLAVSFYLLKQDLERVC
jgi:uncharacterized membrane protein YkgB